MILGRLESTDIVIAASAVGSACWAVAAVWSAVASLRWRSMRRTAWPAVLIPEAVLAVWWAWLNLRRWASPSYNTGEYRRDIAPIVPVLFAVMALNLWVWVRRARRTERLAAVMETQRKATVGGG